MKKGAYGALMDEEDEGSKFCEEDIDQILQRRTQTITIQSEGKGSTFAKVEILLPVQLQKHTLLVCLFVFCKNDPVAPSIPTVSILCLKKRYIVF